MAKKEEVGMKMREERIVKNYIGWQTVVRLDKLIKWHNWWNGTVREEKQSCGDGKWNSEHKQAN